MLSDPVTGLRRRPGLVVQYAEPWEGADYAHVVGWFTDLAGSRVHILLNSLNGQIRILSEDYTTEATLDGGAYLTNSDATRIQAASVGNEFFLVNRDIAPTVNYNTTDPDPSNSGFFYVVAGSFGKEYNVSLVHSGGTISATYTTPDGTASGDAALATPEYITTQLFNQLAGTAFSDVRILTQTLTGSGTSSSHFLQKNTGTTASPVWTTLILPSEISAADLSLGKLRTYSNVTPDKYVTFTFQVKVGGSWVSTVYTSDAVKLPAHGSNVVVQIPLVIPVSTFTSQVDLSGDATLFIQRDGPYVFVTRSGGMAVNTTVGTAYLIGSKSGMVTSSGNLPARLPSAADGYICRVGSGDSPQYYRYDHTTTEWNETGKYGTATGISNVPISIIWDGSAWALDTTDFEGCFAGDEDSNELHEWMQYGITGTGTYQGRLVLMSGPLVSMSASNEPRRFFRSTVTSVVSSDPIEVGAGMTAAAAYEWAVPFQKDLVLISRAYQAVVPSGNTAVTPSTATVVPTSSHETDTTCSPILLGRTLMYTAPRSEDFFGALEMIPSNYTDSQYISQDSTPHLPKYMPGRCRFAVASSVADLALFGSTGDLSSLTVHEYHWDGDTKVQQAWHTWTLPYPVATGYFASELATLVFVQNEMLVLGTIDPRAGALLESGERRPFLDFATYSTIVDNVVTVPDWLLTFDPAVRPSIVLMASTGGLAGEDVGVASLGPAADQLTTVTSWPSGDIAMGLSYYSGVIPSPPTIRSYKDAVIHTGKATLLRYTVGLQNSSDFLVSVSDAYSTGSDLSVPVLTFTSPELALGRGLYADTASVVIPCRTDLRTTAVEMFTEGTGELNITSVEYVGRHHSKLSRR
jgi:hypothetical protein